MSIDRSRRTTFEEAADLFNESRPEYPAALVEEVIRLSDLEPGDSILEVGCGAGNLTIGFARRGYPLLGVELGVKLAGYARLRCQAYSNVIIVQSAFEDYNLPPHSFDLAISADAFHWIQPEIGYPKLINALKETGSIALVWQITVDPQTEWSRLIDETFRTRAPEYESPFHSYSLEWLANIIKVNLHTYCGIEAVTVKTFDWLESFNADRYIKLLQTSSILYDMDKEHRQSLHADIRRILIDYGDRVEIPYRVALFHARVQEQNG